MNILLIIVIILIPNLVYSQAQYYVLPSVSNQSCPGDDNECHTLFYYLTYYKNYLTSNSTFNFLPGIHYLNETAAIVDLEYVSFQGKVEEETVIQCSHSSAGLSFMNISSLVIRDIIFIGCGMELEPAELQIKEYGKTFLNFSSPLSFGIYMNYIIDLKLINVRVHKSKGYGLLGFNLLGDTIIENVHFEKNNYETIGDPDCYVSPSMRCKGGNMLIVYTDLVDCPSEPLQYTLSITNSSFIVGVDSGLVYQPFIIPVDRDDVHLLGGGGIGLHMMQSSYGVHATMTNCTMTFNAAYTGANLYISMWDLVDNSSITVRDSIMNYGTNPVGNPVQIAGNYDIATGFYYIYGLLPISSYTPVCQTDRKYQVEVLNIDNCDISYNEATLVGGGFVTMWAKTFLDHTREIHWRNTNFENNSGDSIAIFFNIGDTLLHVPFKSYVTNCTFKNNEKRQYGRSFVSSISHQVILLNSVQYLEFENCSWRNNSASGIHALQSNVILSGENRFINNVARDGAGLRIEEGSRVFLQSKSLTTFVGNKASEFGGAIYSVMLSYNCFYQVDLRLPLPELVFINNTAGSAGDALYGNIESCLIDDGVYVSDSSLTFLKISTFLEDITTSSSLLSGKANRLCFCSNDSKCDYNTVSIHDIKSYPGQIFQVPVEARSNVEDAGIGDGQTPATVNALIIGNSSNTVLNQQLVHKGCNNISYSLTGMENQTIELSLAPETDQIFFQIFVRVNLQTCPTGFPYSAESQTCGCADLLQENAIVCDIQTFTVARASNQWIGFLNTTEGSFLAVGDCSDPEYCKESRIDNFSFSNADVQCIDSHSGVLCGQCKPGYSITLGSSKCLQCSNNYLALLILFVAAGILLIAFLSILNVTVNTGRINAMLFYANIIKLANYEFFRLREPSFLIFQILINWINLDFGITSCFYDGFDYYTKSWLNFVFPLYLFVLLGVTIFAANKSTKVSKLLPINMLSVSTTIVLISFTKLLRASTLPLTYGVVKTDNTAHVVWLFDGNIAYFSSKHIPLLIFSAFVLIGLLLPFAIIMFSYPFLWSFAAHEGTCFEKFVCFFRRQLFKFKPFLETYDGPFLPKYRYWTGLLVILRLVVYFIVANVFTSGSNEWFKSSAVSAICITLLGIVLAAKIYLCDVNRRFELLYLLNLSILEFLLLVLQLSGQSNEAQGITISISISLAFFTFIGVVIYEKYQIFEPIIYRLRGKEYVSRQTKCQTKAYNRDRESDAFRSQKHSKEDTNTTEFLEVLDTGRHTSVVINEENRKQEELIQHLLLRPGDKPNTT